ncbi:MAG: hypothetical protein WCD43_04445 [Candidatus Acidiferrales bacterium]
MPEDAVAFQRGDFVHLEKGLSGTVGVVWRIYAKNRASVEVYWQGSEESRISQSYEPQDLVLVPSLEVPEYAIELKKSLGL